MRFRYVIGIGILVVALLLGAYATPIDFTSPTLVTIPEGTSFSQATRILEDEHVITSPLAVRVFSMFYGGTRSLRAGDYLFEEPQGSIIVARRLSLGEHGLESVKILLPEGLTVSQVGETIARSLPHFDVQAFERLAAGREGYLFPDTYYVVVNATPEMIIQTLSEHFDVVIAEMKEDIALSGRSLPDIVMMASILEEEAQTPEDKAIVAGILWKRLDLGMALQVDATFKYTLGKASHELTRQDLETDSPYNTYTRTGLPPTPISNPGRASLQATLHPTETPYLYYLTGNDGVMYYAEDFEGHKRNKANHL